VRLQNQKKGSWLIKHIRVLVDAVGGLDLAPIQADLETFNDLIIVRNCIVHAWGKIEEARDPAA
jgi:hypothetical protein